LTNNTGAKRVKMVETIVKLAKILFDINFYYLFFVFCPTEADLLKNKKRVAKTTLQKEKFFFSEVERIL